MGKGTLRRQKSEGRLSEVWEGRSGKMKRAGICLLFLSLPEHLVELFRHSEGVFGIIIRADLLGGLGV